MSPQPKVSLLGNETGKTHESKQATNVKVESDSRSNLQQRRLQRKKQRYGDDSSDDESETSNKRVEENKPGETESCSTKVKTEDNSNEDTSSIMPINAEAISEVANQNLTGELSLLQNYEKKGVMNEVFGSQSVLSQELQANYSQQSVRFPGSPGTPGTPSRVKQEQDTDTHLQSTSSEDDDLKLEDNGLSSSNVPSSASTSKLEANGESLSQASFVFNPNSLPALPVSETQMISDTIPMNDNAPLSQMSALSGYDMIIGAAQALAERDGEHSPFEGADSLLKESKETDKETPPLFVPPMPKLPVTDASENDEFATKLTENRASPKLTPKNQTKKKGNLKASTDGELKKDSEKEPVSTMRKRGDLKVPIDDELLNGSKKDSKKDSPSPTQMKKRVRPTNNTDALVESPKKISRQTKSPKSSPKAKSSASTDTAATSSAAKPGFIQTNGTTYSVRRTKAQRKKAEEETNYIAKRAAELVEQVRVNRKVEKQLLLSMALTRENPRTAPSSYPPKGTVILNGFYWGQFPPLEKVLRSYMEEYYELSIEKCQSRTQQAFNNKLVTLVKAEASKFGWSFDKGAFDEKKIRDRIRCFFKTHIQNAKKRLKTMVRNPLKRANAKALAAHLDLIEKCDLVDKNSGEKSDGPDASEDGESGREESKMPSLPSNNSKSTYDSDAHDAAQVVSKICIIFSSAVYFCVLLYILISTRLHGSTASIGFWSFESRRTCDAMLNHAFLTFPQTKV